MTDEPSTPPDREGEDPRPTRARRPSSRDAPSQEASSAPPAFVGSYEVRGELGRGGMGVVYEARDERLGRCVALKAVTAAVAHDASFRARLEREAKALAAISHPNVATIYGLEEHAGQLYLVLELVQGQTLSRLLKDGPMPLADALAACAQVAAGVAAAHESGVIHRDLKPGNVKVTPSGLVKVLDFGLAERRDRQGRRGGAREERLTDLHDIVGTPGFMSPEQLRDEPVDERCDAWAFGCLLFECLTGVEAFPGASTAERIASTLTREPDLAALPATTPAAVRDLLAWCLQRDPAVRLRDMTAARKVLEGAAADGTPSSRRSSSARRSRIKGNLPVSLTSFVGREELALHVQGLVGEHRLVMLTGAGGCGKTRLALRVASLAASSRPGGAWLVELAAVTDPEQVARQAALAFGLADEPRRSSLESLVAAVEGEDVLVVLDNCEHLLAACASFATALLAACPGARILGSSREALGVPGEKIVTVPSLTLPEAGETDVETLLRSEAVRLFVDRARLASPRFELTASNASAVARACERLDGIPLAVELAAARIKHLSVDELVKRLDDRFRLLTGGSRTALPRQQTLRAAIDWSHDLLTETEQVLLRRLSVFQRGFTLDMAEQVGSGGGIDPLDVLDLLGRLVDKSLILLDETKTPPRYRMLETVRQYAREKLAASGEVASVRTRHRDAVLALVERPQAGVAGATKEWLDRVAQEHENLAEAMDWCLDDPEGVESGLRLVAAAWPYWMLRGHWREGRSRCDAALARAGVEALRELRAAALAGAATLAMRLGDTQAAKRLSADELALARETGNARAGAVALRTLARVALDTDALDEARELLAESLATSRALGDDEGEGITLRLLANVAGLQGNHAAAQEMQEGALHLARKHGDRAGEASSLNNLGLMAREAGDAALAKARLEEALRIAEDMGLKDLAATCLNNLGLVACDVHDAVTARPLLRRSLELRRSLGDKKFTASSLLAFAALALECGELELAARLLGASDAIHHGMGTVTDLRGDRGQLVARARAGLGEERFAALLAEGAALRTDQAVELALRN